MRSALLNNTSRAIYGLLLVLVVILSAEIGARLDDFLFDGVAFSANPDPGKELRVVDKFGWHGRAYGRYKKWKLNRYGFRGPDIARQPLARCTRIMILGASETFGLYESPGMEYPAQLQRKLSQNGCYEVVNAAVVGMELASMRRFWEGWASAFKPKVVLIYPTPHFYLNESVTHRNVGEAAPLPPPQAENEEISTFSSRFVERLRDAFDVPDLIQRWRIERRIAQEVTGKDASWFFRTVPDDRLQMFAAEIEMLIDSIEQRGAAPVLMTHGFRASFPLRDEDRDDLEAHRVYMPRALPDVIALFEIAANEEVKRIAAKRRLPLIDIARRVNGCRACFGDLVHFTDHGAEMAANSIADELHFVPDAGTRVLAHAVQ